MEGGPSVLPVTTEGEKSSCLKKEGTEVRKLKESGQDTRKPAVLRTSCEDSS
jgi:hypothetical protein